jgi:uncharacterized DUF497 family protein
MNFEWDDAKALANEQKHGVSFEEARTVFGDARDVPIDWRASRDPARKTNL